LVLCCYNVAQPPCFLSITCVSSTGDEHGPTQVQAGGEQHVDDVGVVEDNLVVVVHLVEGAAPYGVKDDIGRECDGVGDLTHNFGAADETKANFGGFRHLEI